ncbi:Ff.00g102550.m01.CDS01 [Fusarium sp. VM40]|nr:Ff.00g102550.m01.CDS01 [Fusarium sp. VM40]
MEHTSASRLQARAEPAKHKRTRSGCLNCRRKKRKCDEGRPACGTCRRRNESCEWGLKIAFRAEHAQCLNARHPSMRKMARRRPPKEFEILDVTDEVIRDYNGAETEEEGLDDNGCRTLRASGRSNLVVDGRISETSTTTTGYTPVQRHPEVDISSPASQRRTENAVADLLYFSQNGLSNPSAEINPTIHVSMDSVPIDIITEYPYIDHMQAFTPEGISEDGIFLPGSAYHELHSTLRNHLIQETRSVAPTRSTTPHIEADSAPGGVILEETEVVPPINDFQSSQTPLLSQQEECSLWKNYFDEIAPWLDKFDRDRHFQQIIPTMSKDNDHLRYSMLALSARQLELKHTLPTSRSLALYQEAIHLLLPHLPTRGTAVIATCVILCVLEMLSCSPKAWQRHLDGCASLMEAVGINGFVGGTEQALFWCFARMDICGGLISSVKTLIPISHWASKTLSVENDVELFKSALTFEHWANYAVYLTAQVLDLLAPSSSDPARDEAKFRTKWLKLWKYISEWYQERPAPLHPIMTIASSDTSPFPTILYSNPAAMSGNQLHHTASILMLQNQPSTVRLGHAAKPRSILWHARQVCGITASNEHHGAWTNSVQPLWIAGRCMSHPSEHKAILEMLDRIQRESGWRTNWRVDDLKEFYKCSLSTV